MKYLQLFENYSDLQELKDLENELENADTFSQKIPIIKKINILKAKLGIPTSAEIEKERQDRINKEREEDLKYVIDQINKFDKGEIIIDVYSLGMYNSPIKPFKVNPPFYRGQKSWDDNNDNGGMAVYGNGLYTTTSKKYAKTYGIVSEVDPDKAMPTNPLYFKGKLDFDQFEYSFAAELFKDRNIKGRNNLWAGKYHNIDQYLTKLGYDGVIIKYHDNYTVIVKYAITE